METYWMPRATRRGNDRATISEGSDLPRGEALNNGSNLQQKVLSREPCLFKGEVSRLKKKKKSGNKKKIH